MGKQLKEVNTLLTFNVPTKNISKLTLFTHLLVFIGVFDTDTIKKLQKI